MSYEFSKKRMDLILNSVTGKRILKRVILRFNSIYNNNKYFCSFSLSRRLSLIYHRQGIQYNTITVYFNEIECYM